MATEHGKADPDAVANPARSRSSPARFWTLARIPFNGVLAGVVLAILRPEGVAALDTVHWVGFAVLAVFANVLYTLAYPLDFLMRASPLAPQWLSQGRAVVWVLGTLLAAGLAALTVVGTAVNLPPPR